MTLVKLDSGDYINTEKIEVIAKTENINTGKNSTFVTPHSDWYALVSNSSTVDLTPADRDRIVAEMKYEQKLHSLKMMALQRGLIV